MRFLVAINGSSQSDVILRFSAQFKSCVKGLFTVFTVIEHEKGVQRGEEILAQAARRLASAGVSPRVQIRTGHPAEEILREAEERHYDLVIMGEGAHRRLATRPLLSATTMRVVEHAPCSAIIVKGVGEPIRRILLCDSGAENSLFLSHFVSRLSNLLEGREEITILHVMSQISAWPGTGDRHLRANAEALIEENTWEGEFLGRDIEILERFGIHSNPKVRHGLVVDEILAEIQSGGYDLVVIGAHKSEGWQRLLLQDLARQILIQSECSVLIVR